MTWQEACRILELSNPKSLEEVREAFSIQVKVWHPDRFEGDTKMQRIGTARMKLINEAFAFVRNNWGQRAAFGVPYEFPRTAEPATRVRTGPRDLVTVLEKESSKAKKNRLVIGAKRIHEYLGDATLSVTCSDHRTREVKLKVGESATIEFGRSLRFEIRLLQVRQVYKSQRGMPFPLFYSAADLAVSGLID